MVNIANAKTLLRTVEQHIDAFNMNDWHTESATAPNGFVVALENIEEGRQQCGTTLCLAGFAGLLMGGKIRITNGNGRDAYGRAFLPIGDGGGEDYSEDTDLSWPRLGQEYLGISDGMRSELFYTSNVKAYMMLKDLARGVPDDVVLKSFLNGHYEYLRGFEMADLI